jgi:phosphoglycerol transferase MdoB-like AlkP superfamily enzyme
VVLVESQGLLKSASDMRRVLVPLTAPSIRARYTVNTGAVRFFGATMFGELRTLCRIYVPQAIPQNLPGLDRCLPNVLRRLGYETVSYHGFSRWFYERYLWYPAVGFQRSYFADELKQRAPPMCGTAVHGVCDLWIADQVEHELSIAGKRGKFIYWLTLNSHYPIDSALASQSSFDCAGTDSLRAEIGPCELARIHFQLYTRIAQIALNSQLPPARFIVVGDHMPPFPALSERALYDEERVPFVELIPRTELFRIGGP